MRFLRRSSSILLLLVFVGAQLSSLAHQVAEPHQICSAHGDQIHGGTHEAHDAAEETHVAPPAGDQHCAIDLFFETDPRGSLDLSPLASPGPDFSPNPSGLRLHRTLFRLAPKASPPSEA